MTGTEPQARLQVLLVEDATAEAVLFQTVCRLQNAAIDTTHVACGEEALDLLLDSAAAVCDATHDLVLLDLKLPGASGAEVLARLRDHPNGRRLPVLVLSGSDAPNDIRQCYDLGANAYVAKPDGLRGYQRFVQALEAFWLREVRLPSAA